MKKKILITIIAVVCALTTIFSVACINPIEFKKKGFRILQIADIQYNTSEGMSNKDVSLLDSLIKNSQPDLIILTGDNTSSEAFKNPSQKNTLLAIHSQIAQYFDSKDIPWTTVFGNHDALGIATKFELLEQYTVCKNFIGGLESTDSYTAFVEGDDLVTNYSFPVISKTSGDTLVNLMLLDTGTQLYSSSYASITQSQTDFYTSEYEKLKNQNNGVAVPTLMFLHQPLNMHQEMYKNKDNKEIVPEFTGKAKELGQAICAPKDNSILENAMRANKDVIGVFTGHDHLNYYAGVYNATQDYKVLLASCRQSGYGLSMYPGMSSSFNRGGRVIEIYEDGTFSTADVQCKATNIQKTEYELLVEEILRFEK